MAESHTTYTPTEGSRENGDRQSVTAGKDRHQTTFRIASSWVLFGLGHAVSRLPRYPYVIYNRLMIWSSNLQTGEHGPWKTMRRRCD